MTLENKIHYGVWTSVGKQRQEEYEDAFLYERHVRLAVGELRKWLSDIMSEENQRCKDKYYDESGYNTAIGIIRQCEETISKIDSIMGFKEEKK